MTGKHSEWKLSWHKCYLLSLWAHERWPVLEATRMWWDDIGRRRGLVDPCGCVWWLNKRRLWCMNHAIKDVGESWEDE